MNSTMTPSTETTTANNPAPAADKPTPKVCPHCGSDDVRESSTRRGMDLLPSNIGKVPHRCRGCRGRFYLRTAVDAPAPGSPEARRRKRNDRKREAFWKHPAFRRHVNDITIACGSIVAFAVFLYILARSGVAF